MFHCLRFYIVIYVDPDRDNICLFHLSNNLLKYTPILAFGMAILSKYIYLNTKSIL